MTYLAPQTLADALAMRRDHPDAAVVGGATSVAARRGGDLRGDDPAVVLDLWRVAELHRIDAGAERARLGALVTWHGVAGHPALAPGPFAAVAADVATPVVRRRATLVGGLLAGVATADVAPLALSLDAELVLASSDGERTVPVERIVGGERPGPGELATALLVRHRPTWHRWYRVAGRAVVAPAIVCVAAAGHADGVRICLGAPGPAQRCTGAERAWAEGDAERLAAVLGSVAGGGATAGGPPRWWVEHTAAAFGRRLSASMPPGAR